MIIDFEIRWGLAGVGLLLFLLLIFFRVPHSPLGLLPVSVPCALSRADFSSYGPCVGQPAPIRIRNRCPPPVRGALVGTKLPCNRSQVMPYQVLPGTRQ